MRLCVCRYEEVTRYTAAVVADLVIGTYSTKAVLPTINPSFTERAKGRTLRAWRQDFPEVVVPHGTLYTNTHTVTPSLLVFQLTTTQWLTSDFWSGSW
jgi:hypothetical protein